MTRHFIPLFVLIVATLAASSWCADKIRAAYERSFQRPLDVEILSRADIAGDAILDKLAGGKIVQMTASGNELWTLKELDSGHVLVIKTRQSEEKRGAIEWALTLAFYATIALALMAWLWPLTRDLRTLELAVARFGDRNWAFDANIRPHSQIFPLADTFQRMAHRIDELIASHKDMSNAVAHEIKTPLARMQFELEMARQAGSPEEAKKWIDGVENDTNVINDLITATLNYAILERAGVSINLSGHDFRALLPAIVDSAARDAPPGVPATVEMHGDVSQVICDVQLLDAVIRNLVSNAVRYAKSQVQVRFGSQSGYWLLTVDDDGTGIRESERRRVFDPFVQLDQSAANKTGFGLGLAIVRRIMEWHKGAAVALDSPLGGARLEIRWPTRLP